MSKGQYRPDNPTLLTGELFIPRVDQHGNYQVTIVDSDGYSVGDSTANSLTAFSVNVPTGTAQAVGSGSAVTGVMVQSLDTNTSDIYIGGAGVTTSAGFKLEPGATASLAVNNVAAVYSISGSSGQVLRVLVV